MKNRAPTGAFVLYEAMMALGLSLALVAGVAHVLGLVMQQRRLASEYSVASQEAGNLIESLVAKDWAGTTPEKASQVNLSAECRRWLPDAKLQVQVSDETADIRRISVAIDWPRSSGQGAKPVRLVAWQFRNGEGRP